MKMCRDASQRELQQLLERPSSDFRAWYTREPPLSFGEGKQAPDPKSGLCLHGPCGSIDDEPLAQIRIGIIGTGETTQLAQQWLTRCRSEIHPSQAADPFLFPSFPGMTAEQGYNCGLDFPDRMIETLRPVAVTIALTTLACGSKDSADTPGGTSSESYPAPPAPKPLEWFACTEPELPNTECATLDVPLDYAHPDGETIHVAVSRVAASDPARRIGSLLINPGGPGAPGRSQPVAVLDVPSLSEIATRFDLIGFDPRGVPASTAVDCGDVPSYRTVDWTPDDDAEREALERTMREYVAACEEHTGPLLDFVDAYSVARDMDQLRRALGEETINYWGISYGTVLGAAYADLFPERVRAFVLDAPVGPNIDGNGYVRDRARNHERAFDAFAADCDARPDCAARFGGDFGAAFDRAVERVATTPPVDPVSGETFSESLLAWYVANNLAGLPATGPGIELIVEAALGGADWFVPGLLKDVHAAATPAVAMHCADRDFPDPDVVYGTLVPELRTSAPRFGHTDFPEMLACAYWPTNPKPHPALTRKGAPPILVIGGTSDPTCPYAWAQQLAAELDSGVLLTVDGVGHSPVNDCVYQTGSAYLVNLTMPPEGTVCPSQ